MKIIPTSLKRAYAIRKIAKRDSEARKLITIKENIPSNIHKEIKNCENSLARVIKNKNIALEFTKGPGVFEKSTLMKIHDIILHLPKSIEGGIPFTTLEEKVGHFIPEGLKGKELVEYIKKLVK